MAAIIQHNQCNCRNCRYVERQRSNILRAVRPAGKGISDDMVAIWNDALANYPCQFASPVTSTDDRVKVEVHEDECRDDLVSFTITIDLF